MKRATAICYVTEVDHDQIGGAVTTDKQTIRCLRKMGKVDVIYLERTRFKSTVLSLLIHYYKILRSASKPYDAYFSRGIISSTFLVLLNFFLRRKVINEAFSVPFPSSEVYYVPHGNVESFIRYSVFRFLERAILTRVDGITVVSIEYFKSLIKIGVKENRLHVIPFSVEEAFFKQPIKEDIEATFIFCYAGRFHLYHVLLPIVQAFEFLSKDITDAELLLVGDGPLRPEVEKFVHERKLSRIKFTGMVSHADFPSFLSNVDCLVLLSRAPGMPIGILEAAATGKPIITLKRSNDSTLDSYFVHGKGIFMVETDSPKVIAEAMRRLYSDSELRRTLALEARSVARQNFSEETVTLALNKMLTKVSA